MNEVFWLPCLVNVFGSAWGSEAHPSASKEYGWELCAGWIVIESGARQGHGLDYPQAVREAPA